ncbi:ABC transporter permease [Microbacterium ulmi]|uniref:ABC transporter permease n=1 Tax=Microbacterium ulmi TaxID=179095 RepID=A0A7Y2LZR4_9MICO|nr:ABC transporter permease [Microbacterium ulmi]NII68351.1 ABC-type dipeptide/oligopeptide/nickel transport system permease subunit [Microbacterium ulmi]NNH03114.1 ABC transporter permease [Microbacterium ulmi]
MSTDAARVERSAVDDGRALASSGAGASAVAEAGADSGADARKRPVLRLPRLPRLPRLFTAGSRAERATTAAAAVVLIAIVLIAIFADVLAPFDPTLQALDQRRTGPSPEHWLGTDALGRDLLSRLIVGTRATLVGSVTAVAISAVVGVALGLVAGYFGRRVESALMAVTEVLQAFPGFLLAILVVAVTGPSLQNAAIAVGIAGIPAYIRVVRGSVLTVRTHDYVFAAVGMGAGRLRVIFRYVLPNVVAPIVVLTTLSLGTAVLTVAGLSFLGLGAQPPTPEWGVMVREGRDYLADLPYLTIFPGLAIILLVVSLNLLGDSLELTLNKKRSPR